MKRYIAYGLPVSFCVLMKNLKEISEKILLELKDKDEYKDISKKKNKIKK